VSALRQSTEGRLCVLDDMLRAQARRRRLRRGGLAVVTLLLVVLVGLVLDPGGCGGSDAITINGKEQPRLWDLSVLTAAARQLLHLTT
jgi:hypothetical protein